MLLNSENKCFIKYLVSVKGICNTTKFYMNKFLNKFKKKNNYNNYTGVFEDIFFKYSKKENKKYASASWKSSNQKYQILLATKSYVLDENTDWKIDFDDDEDFESLHRFIWLRYFLSSKNDISQKEATFIENVLKSWCNQHLDKELDQKSLVWHPYTVSERIINIITFYVIAKKKMPISIQNALNFMLFRLIKRLEFYNNGHGNHLINNARALIYYSLYIEDEELFDNSIQLLKYSVENFIIDGFSRDASSHYQLLLYYWFEDLNKFSAKYKRVQLTELLTTYNSELKHGIDFFCTKDYQTIMLVGDISPDYPPKYLMTLLNDKLFFLDEYSLSLLYKRL